MASLQAALNFKSVLRTDPSASQVVLTSSHAVLYVFKEDSGRWERAEIEGTLLLYSRTVDDPWAFIILNRLHANNYRQLCGEIDSFQREDELLMYRTKSGSIFGLWLYSEEDKEALFDWLQRILANETTVAVVEASPQATRPQSPRHSVDIVSQLQRAAQKDRILNQLFASHQTPSRPSAAPAPLQQQQQQQQQQIQGQKRCDPMGYLLHKIVSAHGNALRHFEFRKLASQIIKSDDLFWEELYDAYSSSSSTLSHR